LRIIRIAIHPQLQGQGLGKKLLAEAKLVARQRQCDFLGSSFGINRPLLHFWQACGYRLARLGLSKDAASGEHSAMLLQAVSEQARFLQRQICRDFSRDFPYLLVDEFCQLEPLLVARLLSSLDFDPLTGITARDIQAVKAFALGHRLYGNCVAALFRSLLFLCQHYERQLEASDPLLLELAIRRVLQKQQWQTVAQVSGLTGKKQILAGLREFFNKHLTLLSCQ
jgi:tRNA(Met) cytidine acetyltransferase